MDTFVLKIEQKTGREWQLLIIDPDERIVVERPVDAASVDRFARDTEACYSQTSPQVSDLAARLAAWLQGSGYQWLDRLTQQFVGLTLHIETDHALRHAPWELLGTERVFRGSKPHRLFTPVRLVSARCSQVRPQIRALCVGMVCSPKDTEPCSDVGEEESLVLEATQRQPIELLVEESGTLEGLAFLAKSRTEGIDVLHLRSHVDIAGNQPRLLLENEEGLRQLVSAEDIAAFLGKRWPRLVFISSYERERSPIQIGLNSLCEALVRLGAPTVLGWVLPAGNTGSRVAAATLFHCFAAGVTIDEAVARTRQALLVTGSANWHRLRLYADASPLTALVTPPAAPVHTRVTPGVWRARRSATTARCWWLLITASSDAAALFSAAYGY